MKSIAKVIVVLGLISSPVFADEICRDDAASTGYLGAVDLLPPCDTSPPAVQRPVFSDAAVAPTETMPDMRAITQAKGPPTR